MKTNKIYIFIMFFLYYVSFCCVFVNTTSLQAETYQHVIISTVDQDKTIASYSWIQQRKHVLHRPTEHHLIQTIPPIRISSFGQFYYIMEGTFNRITAYSVMNLNQPIWQYATRSSEDIQEETLPWDIIFINENKAYLLRYGCNTAWIINPSATSENNFKMGSLNLSVYGNTASDNGIPEMCCGVVVGSKVFIALKRLDANNLFQKAYIAVFDANTDTQINTGKGEDTKIGIPLQIKNPIGMQYVENQNSIYVYASGAIDPQPDYSGGIERIDSETFDTKLLLDDGNDLNHPYGYITAMVVISDYDIFFVGADSQEDNTLYHFNPKTEVIKEVLFNVADVNYLKHKSFSGFAVDQDMMLWIGNQTDQQIVAMNTTPKENGRYSVDDDTIMIPTINNDKNLFPLQIVFCEEPILSNENSNPSEEVDTSCFIKSMRGK